MSRQCDQDTMRFSENAKESFAACSVATDAILKAVSPAVLADEPSQMHRKHIGGACRSDENTLKKEQNHKNDMCPHKLKEKSKNCFRPHHLLCTQKFIGYGYNEAFTAHMEAVLSELSIHPHTWIEIVKGCDDLCGACPHNKNGVCISQQKTARMDEAVLQVCGLSYGDKIPWKKLADTVRTRIFETEEFHRICASCQWLSLCTNEKQL